MAVNAWMARSADNPPSMLAFMVEVPRAAWTVTELAFGWKAALRDVPKGDGRPVLILPGLFNSDRSNVAMKHFLRRLGYRTWGWQLGRNFGARTVGRDAERLIARIEQVRDETGEKVTLVGVSLGGVMARIVSHRRPDLVREVITVSSPYAGSPTSTNVWRAFELLTGDRIDDPAVVAQGVEAAAPPPVPTTAIWSRSDGLVNGLICHDDACRSIEVTSGHLGVQLKPEVLRAVAGVLGSS